MAIILNKILPRSFYIRDTPEVAQDLLGKLLVHVVNGEKLIGIISETEAYRSDDEASHAFRGKTAANEHLFGQVGHAYLYRSYGLHTCFNVVAYDRKNFIAGGVLIRGIIPFQGIQTMKILRQGRANIGSGPGNVAQALALNIHDNGIDLANKAEGLYITTGYPIDHQEILSSPRIGISKNKDILWRFYLDALAKKALTEKLILEYR